jgi:hypothetical protein
MGSRPVAAFVRARFLAATATLIAACGGGGSGGEPPFVPQPSPDCSPPTTPTVSALTSVAGPATDPIVCVQPIGQSTLPASRVQHLGSLAVNTTARFDVPAGTGSFTIVEQAVQASTADVTFAGNAPLHNTPVPMKIIDPSGAVFYDDMAAAPSDFTAANAIYPAGRQGMGTFTAPNTSHVLSAWARGVPAGRWSFIVGDYAAECASLGSSHCSSGADATGVYDVTVLLRPGPVPTTGTIDFNVYLVTTRFQASTAPADPGLTRMVTTLGSILADAGICVGRVTFIDVPDWAKAKYATGVDVTKNGPCDNLSQLFTLSLADDAIQIFLVDDIQQNGATGLRTVGVDGAIPGPSTVGGTILSGAIVNASDIGYGTCGSTIDFACGSDSTAAVTAHEAGHWLGLLHTTEMTGTLFDTLSDTGTCVCSQCVPPGSRASCGAAGPSAALVTSSDCSGGTCSGADNLMFWLMGGRALSAQQGQLMRANPAVR